jgi:hypothetical protein
MPYEDLPLHRAESTEAAAPPPRSTSPTRWVVIGAGAVIAGTLLALWWMSRAQPAATVPAPAAATDVALGSKRPKKQPLELPGLADSDTFIADLVATLSRHPMLARLFATKSVVRGLALAVVQIGEGKTPASPLAVLRPASRLRILGGSSGRVEPVTYIRWDGAVGALVSVSPADTAQVYVNVKPLFDEAYRELGHPDGDFDEAIVRAIRTLDATPNIAGDPVLLERPTYFEHEDPALRSLLPVQKQWLLIGPAHRQRVMAWLKQLAANLELKVD